MRTTRTRDEGFAMVVVMGAIALITVVALGGYLLSSNVLGESQRVEAESRAFQIAQSALDYELAGFKETNDYTGDLKPMDDGQYSVVVAPVPNRVYQYDMTVTGYLDDVSESITMRFYSMDLWGMNIAAGDTSLGGGSDWNGQAAIEGPLFVKGTVELGANSSFDIGPLFIYNGDLVVKSGAADLGGALGSVDIYCTGEVPDPIPSKWDVGTVSSSCPNIKLPWVDQEYMEERLAVALEESVDNVMGTPTRSTLVNTESTASDPDTYETLLARSKVAGASDHYKYVGSGTTMGTFGAGTHDLTIDAASFGAWEGNGYPLNSGLHDDFAFDAALGRLYVEGTVFIDGDLMLGDNVKTYVGNGSLVVNGDVQILGDLGPASGISAEQALGIVTPGDVAIGDPTPANNGSFTGAIFSNGTVGMYGSASSTHGSWYEGSILCDTILGSQPNQVLRISEELAGNIPDGMPLAGGRLIVYGNWTRQ